MKANDLAQLFLLLTVISYSHSRDSFAFNLAAERDCAKEDTPTFFCICCFGEGHLTSSSGPDRALQDCNCTAKSTAGFRRLKLAVPTNQVKWPLHSLRHPRDIKASVSLPRLLLSCTVGLPRPPSRLELEDMMFMGLNYSYHAVRLDSTRCLESLPEQQLPERWQRRRRDMDASPP